MFLIIIDPIVLYTLQFYSVILAWSVTSKLKNKTVHDQPLHSFNSKISCSTSSIWSKRLNFPLVPLICVFQVFVLVSDDVERECKLKRARAPLPWIRSYDLFTPQAEDKHITAIYLSHQVTCFTETRNVHFAQFQKLSICIRIGMYWVILLRYCKINLLYFKYDPQNIFVTILFLFKYVSFFCYVTKFHNLLTMVKRT